MHSAFSACTVYYVGMKLLYILPALLLFPTVSYANSFQDLLTGLITFVNTIVLPFLLTVAFLFFVINAVRYFIIGSTQEEGREKAKALAIYGVSAVVLMVVFWGIVNLFVDTLGLGGAPAPQSDYVDRT
jgi:succinate dehydrogenase/fumarate reductase cytochrome b subunit